MRLQQELGITAALNVQKIKLARNQWLRQNISR